VVEQQARRKMYLLVGHSLAAVALSASDNYMGVVFKEAIQCNFQQAKVLLVVLVVFAQFLVAADSKRTMS